MTNKEWKTTTGPSGNQVLNGEGFYISYMPSNGMDAFGSWGSDSGSDETALCKDGEFFILNGDFRKEYAKIIEEGFDRCLDFYEKNLEAKSSWSGK